MPDTERPVGILVAVEEELAAILDRVPQAEKRSVGGIPLYHGYLGGHPVVVAKSGMGRERARAAARLMIQRHSPSCLLVVGFAAALSADIPPGTVIIADSVVDDEASFASELMPDSLLIEGLKSIQLEQARVGQLITVSQIARTPEQKNAAASRRPNAVALDMESAGAALVAHIAEIPWVVVRAVTDGPTDRLPLPFERFVSRSSGEVNRVRLAGAVLLQPWKLSALLKLGERSKLAAENLAGFLEAYIKTLPEAKHDSVIGRLEPS